MNENPHDISRRTVLKTFLALTVVAFLLRIFYAGNLYQDDGLWFTAGEEILRGKVLYREIYFDKPPVLPLLYALLFKIFGASILTIRLFTIGYSVAVAFALYRFGAYLYDRSKGLLAAAMFVVFSTTYTTGHFQGLNTDLLMTLPYTLAAYWFVRAATDEHATSLRLATALASGVSISLAFQTNPKGIFDLLFVVLGSWFVIRSRESGVWSPESEIALQKPAPESATVNNRRMEIWRVIAYCVIGLVLGAVPFYIYLAASGSLADYWQSVWVWGSKYARYYPLWRSMLTALRQSLGYFTLNNILLIALVVVAGKTLNRFKANRGSLKTATGAGFKVGRLNEADALMLLWFAVSFIGMSVGGRFFGHYFFQILPALCLIGASGMTEIIARLKKTKVNVRRMVYGILISGFAVTLVRFHARTAGLAVDELRGAKSEMTQTWYHERLNREEFQAAQTVKEIEDEANPVKPFDFEKLRRAGANITATPTSADYLFVWGYRPEIYYWSGLLPASRYLSSQQLTGVPADVHFFSDEFALMLDEATTAAHRAQLLTDLQMRRPKFIVDELAAYNSQLAMSNYPELKNFLNDYKLMETDKGFFIYFLRNPKDKKKNASGRE
ncbi:MAG: glycosyltransferase family 39 protein [Acidobacteriota bacterium]